MKYPSITELVLRDGQQSLIATRMRLSDMTPILSKLDNIGFSSLEVWGGATYDCGLRFLNEDPWKRLSVIKSNVKSCISSPRNNVICAIINVYFCNL